MKVFGLYSTEDVKVQDVGLKRYINLDVKLVLKTHGRFREKFGKAKVNVVERLINKLQVPGHRGKKHKLMKRATGKFTQEANVVLKAFELIQASTKTNPLQILVNAIENSAPYDEITTIEYGGARYPQAVDCSPLRRLNLALKHLVEGARDRAWRKSTKLHEALAQEIMLAAKASPESFAVKKRIEIEKQAASAR